MRFIQIELLVMAAVVVGGILWVAYQLLKNALKEKPKEPTTLVEEVQQTIAEERVRRHALEYKREQLEEHERVLKAQRERLEEMLDDRTQKEES